MATRYAGPHGVYDPTDLGRPLPQVDDAIDTSRIWQTNDGRIIEIREMEDDHLQKAVRFLEERQRDGGRYNRLSLQGLTSELMKRNLPKLPLRPRELARAVAAISNLRVDWLSFGPDERRQAREALASFLRNVVGTEDAKIAADHIENDLTENGPF